jgi:hypothetical protein
MVNFLACPVQRFFTGFALKIFLRFRDSVRSGCQSKSVRLAAE